MTASGVIITYLTEVHGIVYSISYNQIGLESVGCHNETNPALRTQNKLNEVLNKLNYGDKSDFIFPASPSASLFSDTFENTNKGLNEPTISITLPRGQRTPKLAVNGTKQMADMSTSFMD